MTLEEVIETCAHHMFESILNQSEDLQYDVVTSAMDSYGSWHIVLKTILEPAKLYDFSYIVGTPRMTVSTYLRVHQFYIGI